MRTITRGNASEAAVVHALISRGIHIYLPFGDGRPFDLVAEVGPAAFLRVQCKTAWLRNGCVEFNAHRTDHGHGAANYVGLADVFGVRLPQIGSAYLVPVADVPRSRCYLRIEPTRNNQRRGVRFAADYEIDRWSIDELRAITERARLAIAG